MEFTESKTMENLMLAFTGESQARNRYTFAYEQAKAQKHYAVAELFRFTAEQEKAHAQVFYNHLKEKTGQTVQICGDFPVDIYDDLAVILRKSAEHENSEANEIYTSFAQTAREEGFEDIAADFEKIAGIESVHRGRFEKFAELMEQNKLYDSEQPESWVCLNCGYIFEGTQAPESCPVCGQEQGYYVRLSSASV